MPRRPSQMIQTSHGLMEYALHGAERGAAVILCHGTGGGYDQGLMLARLLDGFQGIAVSRAGYLRTPVGTGCSPGASPVHSLAPPTRAGVRQVQVSAHDAPSTLKSTGLKEEP